MTRRRKASPAEGLLEIISLMPWWTGVALAVVSYFLLHRLALQPVTASAQPGQLGSMVAQTLWRTLASFGQYIVPLICLAGAGASAWRRRERRQLVATVADARSADVLDGMSWRQFEKLVGEGFRLQGYRVAETGGGGADGGVDLVLAKGSEKFLVQCKQWRSFKVGVEIVRELYGVMAARGAAGGFVVTSGRFTADAAAFAKGRNVQLIDGPRLRDLIQSARGDSPKSATPVIAAAALPSDAGPATTTAPSVPSCPLCTQPMVMRTAKRGANAGAQFWGCSGYPTCRGTRALN
ncbi:restriction endonuclease [Ideonella sp. YS5]|uniref:restriction endonuclease n=1 Tax=Ideonella sp. YS5 TaxID=3453714 RepID=UPI003EEF5EDA